MSLINCPNCGKRISDKAIKCPKCGKNLRKNYKKRKINSKKIVVIITSLIGILLIFSVIVGIIKYKEYQEKIAKEEIKKQKQIEEEYYLNLMLAISQILDGGAESEKAGNLIKKVWYNTIYEKNDIETNSYTKNQYGTFNYDFNDSLENLYSDFEFQSTIRSIKENQESVKNIMKKLKTPPNEYEEAYDTLKDFYDSYVEFTNLILNPNGSYQTFSNAFIEKDSEMAKCYKTMEIYIEE